MSSPPLGFVGALLQRRRRGSKKKMERPRSGRVGNRGGIEENTLAMLDATGDRESQYVNDDRVAFIEAVRASSLVPDSAIRPTNKMYEAILRILKDGKSPELIMASYHLLIELDKRFPLVHFSNDDDPNVSAVTTPELVVVKETWSPFVFGVDAVKDSVGPVDPSGFNILIQELAEVANEANFHGFETKFLGNMLLLQYLINVLEFDFSFRHNAYNETMNWTFVKNSLLNALLGSRRISYKGLIKDCLSIMCYFHGRFCQNPTYPEVSVGKQETCNTYVEIALLEVQNSTSNFVQRLLVMIMELDASKKKADTDGLTTRADGIRISLMDIILDEFTYNKDILPTFLQVFDEPKWKLEIIVKYFSKYIVKPSARTKKSNASIEDAALDGVLMRLSNKTSTKSIIKKIGSDVAQILLAHAFQAYVSLYLQQYNVKSTRDFKEDVIGSCSSSTCENLISAFNCLKDVDGHMEILPLGKEALFMAATILSTKSQECCLHSMTNQA